MAVMHGGDIYSIRNLKAASQIMDFSANINPLGTPEKIKNAVRSCIDELGAYPDTQCRDFCNAAARYHNVSADFICTGNGAADVIFRLVYAAKPKTAVVCAPTFGEYEQALGEVGCEVKMYPLGEGFCIKEDFERFIDGADMMFICNPNNPTGVVTDGGFIENMVQKYKDTLFVIDECFLDMTECEKDCSMISKVHLYSNIWIIKSLTKMYALAGLRIGYGICSDRELCKKVKATGQPWAVSSVALAAGAAAFECDDEKDEFLRIIKTERSYVTDELVKLGFDVVESAANFVLFRVKGVHNLKDRLCARGILIRSCADYRGLGSEFYRVCIKTRKENDIMIKAVREEIYG